MMIEGEGADCIPRNKENFVVVGVEMVFKKFGVPVPELAYVSSFLSTMTSDARSTPATWFTLTLQHTPHPSSSSAVDVRRYFCKNGIPFGSGLGSSSAAIVSGLLAGKYPHH